MKTVHGLETGKHKRLNTDGKVGWEVSTGSVWGSGGCVGVYACESW